MVGAVRKKTVVSRASEGPSEPPLESPSSGRFIETFSGSSSTSLLRRKEIHQRSSCRPRQIPEPYRRSCGETSSLRDDLAAKTRECTKLLHQLDAAATVIAALHHDNTLLRQELHHAGEVIPFNSRREP